MNHDCVLTVGYMADDNRWIDCVLTVGYMAYDNRWTMTVFWLLVTWFGILDKLGFWLLVPWFMIRDKPCDVTVGYTVGDNRPCVWTVGYMVWDNR